MISCVAKFFIAGCKAVALGTAHSRQQLLVLKTNIDVLEDSLIV
jgi:hypothetical protein